MGILLLLLLMDVAVATAQTQTPPTSPPPVAQSTQSRQSAAPKPDGAAVPTDASQNAASAAALERIKERLENLPVVHFDTQPRYFAQAFGGGVTFMDLVGSFDLKHGPVPYAGMTHQEFLNMVHPKDLYSTTGITPLDMLQVGLVNYAMQRILQQGYVDIKRARTEQEIRLIRERIDLELKALAGK